MSKRAILIVIIICVSAFGFFKLAEMFAPGSYPYAEHYDLNTDELIAIDIIEDFKKDNPIYKVPESAGIKDGRRDSSDYWYHIYFHYPEENQIVKTWIRSKGKNEVTLALVAINSGLSLGNWKLINHDFSQSENHEQKRKFEERILNKIKDRILPKE